MKSMIQAIALVALLLTGCSKDTGSGNGGPGLGSDADWETPAGSFGSQTEVIGTDPEQYGPGCKTPGQSEPINQIDPRLKPGQVFSYFVKGIYEDDSIFSATFDTTVIGVTATSFTTKTRILTVSGAADVAPGSEFTSTCNLGATAVTCSRETINLFMASGQTKNCSSVKSDVTDLKQHRGLFKTKQNNVSYISWFQTYRSAGTFSCDGGKTNFKGTQSSAVLLTNSVPTRDANRICGGVPIFVGGLTKDSTGKVMAGFRMELLGFKNP